MIKLKAKLVTFSITTRVIAPIDLSEDELVKVAKHKLIKSRLNDADENVESIETDTEDPLTEEDKKSWVVGKFKELLLMKKNMEVDTFEFCSDRGYELDNSTIDKIVGYFPRNEIRIYYNINTYDGKNIDEFDADDLIQFYDGLTKWLKEHEE